MKANKVEIFIYVYLSPNCNFQDYYNKKFIEIIDPHFMEI